MRLWDDLHPRPREPAGAADSLFYAPKQCLKRNAKKVKKLLKKGLTNEITFGMIIKLLANEVHTEQTNANLENDTEQERTQRDR